MDKITQNPSIRFKRDDGTEYPDWKKKKIGDILTLCHGKDYRHLSKGNIPVIGTGGIITYVNKALCDWECVCIGRKGTINKPYFMNIPFWSVDTLFYSKPLQNNIPKFQYYLFQNINWKCYNEASSIPSLSASTIENIKIIIPCVEEQQKIADFLSNVDEVIAQSEAEIKNLEQQKKGVMQKIFSQEVRFKREDGTEFPEWEIDTIGNRIIVTSCKRVHQSEWTEIDVPFYRAREIVALYNNEKISPLHISKDTYDTYSSISGKISKGDLLVTGVGTIGIPYLVKDTDVFYFKDGNIIWFQNDESSILGYYLFYVFGTDELKTQILNNSGKGTVHTYTIANAKETNIPIPCLEEQQKIADFLSAYDEAITYAKQELGKWKELKKGFMQKMFI